MIENTAPIELIAIQKRADFSLAMLNYNTRNCLSEQ